MATEQELAQALGPAFGIYPKAFRGNYGNPQDAANLPVDVLRGRTAGLLGMFGDVVNQPIAFPPARAAQLAIQGLSGQEQYKYPDTEHFLKTMPLAPTSRAGEVAGQAASFVPLNPAPAVRAAKAGVQALGPTASNMAEDFLMRRGLMPTLDVYHGTPHTFPPTERNPLGEFDASKIGTGEGAQAYGLGIYTAENPAVAGGYRDKLQKVDYSGSQIDPANPSHVALATMEKFGDTEKASAYLKQRANLMDYDINMQAAKLLDDNVALPTRNAYGSLYKVDLPDEMIPKMLDYDKPLSKQDPYVRDIIAKAFPSGYINGKFVDPLNSPVTGRAMLDQLNMIANQRNEPGFRSAETALRQAGIPGIKYLDETSRAKGEGTRNFVTFPGEEKNLTILERKGYLQKQGLMPSVLPTFITDRSEVKNIANDFADKFKQMGFDVTVDHSGSKAGASSYLRVSDPQTGRFLSKPIRISDHSKGAKELDANINVLNPQQDFAQITSVLNDMRAKGDTLVFKQNKYAQKLIGNGVKPKTAYDRARIEITEDVDK